MLAFSLVVATLGRSAELEALFRSLLAQDYPALECIVVDQNLDRRVKDIVDRCNGPLKLRVVDSAPGLSHARNVGMTAATGDILAFPDDDCWYTPDLLANVSAWFESHPEYNVLTVGAADELGVPSGNRWIQDSCEIRPTNAFRTTFSSTIFVRRTAATIAQQFDESIGVGSGTPYSCGEETDYVLNLVRAGSRGYFNRTWHIGHPKRDMLSGQIDGRRAAGYGCGMGYVLRKHSEPLLLTGFVAYDLLRTAMVALQGDFAAARLCLRHAWGMVAGYAAHPLQSLPLDSTSLIPRIS
jgi:glycosyltransferase involved in cell wall biosynthesis